MKRSFWQLKREKCMLGTLEKAAMVEKKEKSRTKCIWKSVWIIFRRLEECIHLLPSARASLSVSTRRKMQVSKFRHSFQQERGQEKLRKVEMDWNTYFWCLQMLNDSEKPVTNSKNIHKTYVWNFSFPSSFSSHRPTYLKTALWIYKCSEKEDPLTCTQNMNLIFVDVYWILFSLFSCL